MYITKTFFSDFRTTAINTFPPTSLTYFLVNKAFIIIYLLYFNFFFINHISIVENKKYKIPNTTFILL